MYRSGGSWLTTWTPQLVSDAPDPVAAFAEYAQQKLGVPWPTANDMRILRKKVTEFFGHYPRLTITTLCRVVDWAKSRRRRFDRVWKVVEAFRYAYKDGFLPELDPAGRDEDVETRIAAALAVETDPNWRRWLIVADGVTARTKTITDWEHERGSACGVH